MTLWIPYILHLTQSLDYFEIRNKFHEDCPAHFVLLIIQNPATVTYLQINTINTFIIDTVLEPYCVTLVIIEWKSHLSLTERRLDTILWMNESNEMIEEEGLEVVLTAY